ncbi:MAG TPA: hypothetical protein VN861_16425 [Candidatus Acidoferrales bacterium]|nr:hypothetical protein [Candidatus Acidoferrales bacterium]
MALRGKQRTAARDIAEAARINRIARATPITTPPPTDGLLSQAELLGQRLTNLREHGRAISAAFHIHEIDIWEEMLTRAKGHRP